jgi:hypothetical protein
VRVLREAGPAPAWRAGAGAVEREASPAPGAARDRVPDALFAALLLLGLVPLWAVAHVPTQDGGNHVEAVLGLLELPRSALLQRFYLPNYGLQPNWLTQILFAGLVQVTSPAVAEKLVLSGYLLLLPLAFRAALPRTARGRWAALSIFPFVASYPFHMGFWNFSYSLVLWFVTLGFWYRTRGRLGARRGLAFGALFLLLFVAHSVSTAAALAAMSAILGWRLALGWVGARGRPARRRRLVAGYLRRGLATALCAAPTLALLAAFMVRQPKPLSYRPPFLDYLKHFFSLYALVSFDRWEIALGAAVALAVALGVGLTLRERRRRRLRPVDGWLAAAVVATALYFAMPDAVADGAQLNDRLALYPFFAALLWLGLAAGRRARVRAVALALAALFLAGTAFRLVRYRELDGYLADYAAVASQVPEGSTILPLTFAPLGPRQGGWPDGKKLLSYRVHVFQHAAGWIAAARHGVDLDNSQANTQHTPLRWRPELNPFTLMNTVPFGMEAEPPCVELWPYQALVGRIDAVLVWGATPQALLHECGAAVAGELAAGYRRAWVSPRGLMQLYLPAEAATVPSHPRIPGSLAE